MNCGHTHTNSAMSIMFMLSCETAAKSANIAGNAKRVQKTLPRPLHSWSGNVPSPQNMILTKIIIFSGHFIIWSILCFCVHKGRSFHWPIDCALTCVFLHSNGLHLCVLISSPQSMRICTLSALKAGQQHAQMIRFAFWRPEVRPAEKRLDAKLLVSCWTRELILGCWQHGCELRKYAS